jgi:hypothetical protein
VEKFTRKLERLVLFEYPYDGRLLSLSRLYRRSRRAYLDMGGRYYPTLVSAARTLSSPILLEPRIEYTPMASELEWALTDRLERKNPRALPELRRFSSSVYHEQNHRILWKLLPPLPQETSSIRRYLNFAESLVITLDMALGDELGPKNAAFFKAVGLIYDPGTDVRRKPIARRVYRNYLQACLHATYLNLELFKPEAIAEIVRGLYHNAGPLVDRAINRSGNLNTKFLTQTNLVWQRKHRKKVVAALSRPGEAPLEISSDPLNNIQQYMFAERWFERFDL